jgi:glycosyltransferase involved in cell wall biosynthesis
MMESSPKFSIIIPTYNGKEYLAEAIRSVLDQTFTDFEVIIVDDASPEDVTHIVNSFMDARVRYIRHEKNKGAVAARKTGVAESTGEIIAFLDQDDIFHKQKLEVHFFYHLNNPDIGLTYNDRFVIQGVERTISGIYRAPASLRLTDWVLGFPTSPSDIVVRREWALRDEIWDDSFAGQAEHVIFNGQEIVFGGRLALGGCKFGSVGRALNYRRYHPHRIQKYLSERCQAELDCQEIIFSDPRCTEPVRALKNLAASNIYSMWAYVAYIQEDFDMGRRFLTHAMKLNPGFFLDGATNQFLNNWLHTISALDAGRSHEEIVQSIFENLPAELQFLQKDRNKSIAQSYMLNGLRAIVWGKPEEAENYLKIALESGANVDDTALNMLCYELLNYDGEVVGKDSLKINNVIGLFSKLFGKNKANSLEGYYFLNRAFLNYHAGRYESVPVDVLRAARSDKKHLLNKGMFSVLIRSLYHQFNFQFL